MPPTKDDLAPFHPLIREWFETELGEPTDVQAKAWPEIAEGKHVLATAPTGSGKTLTAFLWALNQLISSEWELGMTRVPWIIGYRLRIFFLRPATLLKTMSKKSHNANWTIERKLPGFTKGKVYVCRSWWSNNPKVFVHPDLPIPGLI